MKFKNSTLSTLLVLLIFFQVGQAQIRSISGTIRNAVTLEPLPYANLVIKDTYLGGTSNVDGYFYLSGLEDDSLEVVCSYIGYVSFSQKFYYQGESHIIIPIAMQPQTLGGEEVLVEDSLLISPQINVIAQSQGFRPPSQIALKEPKTKIPEGYSFELRPPMRWLPPTGEFTNYIIDGVPAENSRHLYNVYPAFNLDAVKHIEEHPAGNIRQTSTDQLGATELIYREGNRAETDVRAMLGLVESGLTTSGPHSAGGSWYLSGRRADFDAIYSLRAAQTDSVYQRFRPDYYFYDVDGKVTFDISDATKISGNTHLTFDKLHWLGDRGLSAHSSWYNGFMSTRIQHQFTPRLLAQTNAYAKTYHSFLRADQLPMGLDRTLDGDFVNALVTQGLSTQADYFLGGNNRVSVVASAEHLSSELNYVDSSSSGNDQGWLVKAKAGYRYTLPYNLSTDLGLQGVYSSLAESMGIYPSVLLNWEPSNIYHAYLSLVQSAAMLRTASLSNTLFQPILDMIVPVDTSLAVPENLNLSFGGHLMPVIGYDFQAELFTRLTQHPTLIDSAWNGKFERQQDWLNVYGSEIITGLNLALEKRTPGIHGMVKYRFSRGKLTDLQDNESRLPGHREHEFYLVLDGKFRADSGYRLDLTLASGKRFLEADQSWNWSDPYHRLDLSFYKDVSWDRVAGRVSLRLINLSNAQNLQFDPGAWVTSSLQDRAFALLPFTPTLNVDFIF